LKHFPITKLKIDRDFITDLRDDPQDQAIIQAILSLGQGLQLEIVAEGVETQAQLETLKTLGCVLMQGYLCSPPLPYETLLAWVESR